MQFDGTTITAKVTQPRAFPHGKKDGPRRTPKHVTDHIAHVDSLLEQTNYQSVEVLFLTTG